MDKFEGLKQVEVPDAKFELKMPAVETGGCSVFMVGSTRSGKSTALKYILDRYFKKHIGAIFTMTARANAYKEMKYPNLPLSIPYIPELVRDAYKINTETGNRYPFLFVLDDQPLLRSDKELVKLCAVYRNSGLSSIICCQVQGMVNPTMRSNLNFILLFHLNTTEQIENTVKSFLRGIFPKAYTMEHKIAWYKMMTADHHFIFLDTLNGTIQRCKIDIGK
jgi:hypothetical protein